jgi:hypothetical protein
MKSAITKYLFLLVLALIGFFVYSKAPSPRKVISIAPSTEFSKSLQTYADSSSEGQSRVALAQVGSTILCKTTFAPASKKDVWAGFGWDLDQNWDFMDTLYLEVRASGIPELELKLLTYDPDYSKAGDPSTYRQVVKEVPVSNQWQKLAIAAEHFYVPDWWYTQTGVSKNLDSRHFEQVLRLNIQPSSKAPRGVPLEFEVRSLTLTGTNSRNLAIFLGYLFVLMIFALGVNPHKRRVAS